MLSPEPAPPRDVALADWPEWLRSLEAAHACLRRAGQGLQRLDEPPVDLRPAARALEQVLAALFDAADRRSAPLAGAQAAMDALEGAMRALAVAAIPDPTLAPIREALGRAHALSTRAADLLSQAPSPPLAEALELRASIDVPGLHWLRRPSLVLPIDVPAPRPVHAAVLPPPIPPPATVGELREAVAVLKDRARAARDRRAEAAPKTPAPALHARAGSAPVTAAPEPRPGFARDIGEAVQEQAFLRDRTRVCLEEVAMVGMQRAPLLGDPWRGALFLERRMLHAVDVVAGIGAAAVAHVPRLLADAPIKDASHAFAAAMILGCIGGRDALAAAERALFSNELDPSLVEGIGAAFKLVPHDMLPLALRTLAAEPDVALRAMAIDVLGYRGLAAQDELAVAAATEPAVAATALVHLAAAHALAPADLTERAIASGDGALVEAAWTALALAGQARWAGALAGGLEGPFAATAALLLAMAGDEQDASRLLSLARHSPTAALTVALGWAGATTAVSWLMELLEHDDAEIPPAAAWALERITGAGLWDEVEVPAEEIDVSAPPEPDVGEPRPPRLVQLMSDPRDMPDTPAPDRVEQPTTDPARWHAYWKERGHAYDARGRYRMGQPYSPLVSLAELDVARRTPSERRLLHRELIVRTGAMVRFDPHDFVAVHEQALRAWEPLAQAASGAPGVWTRPARSSR